MDVLKDKAYKDYEYTSRYASFPYYYHTCDKKYVQGLTGQLDDNSVFVLHKVKKGETLDSIALDSYSNSTFFWVIADFNHIQDPFAPLEVDSMLKIPTLASIKFKEI